MATQRDIETLSHLYLDARDRLLRTITGETGAGTKTYANTVLKQLEAELESLKRASKSYIDTQIPQAYKKELDSLYAYFKRNNLLMKNPRAFASLHNETIYVIAREMQHQLNDALITVGRQVTRYVDRAQDEALRQAGLRQTGIKNASGGTVGDMQRALVEDLREHGFMTVQYGSGTQARQVPVDVYAATVARSTTREAGNTARLNQLTANGYDLVKMTEHYPTCDVCAMHQGRVYSISGNDKRFPPLSLAFGKYNNVHPNCRHVVGAWIESLQTPEEVKTAISESNRPFKDTRSLREVKLYNEQQDKNRRARETLYQYERYKARLGEDAPKSLQAFSRIKRQGGEQWGVLQSKYRAMGYYDKAIAQEPAITKAVTGVAESVGMKPAGLEYRVKSRDSFLRKVAANYSPNGTQYEVKDILRYTLTAPANKLSEKTLESIAKLENLGYNTSAIKNTWLAPANPYKGINTFVTAPSGQRLELQYHTPESFALKDGDMHRLYEEWRQLPHGSVEYLELEKQMAELSKALTVPADVEGIK